MKITILENFGNWFHRLTDATLQAGVNRRIYHAALGDFGDHKPMREGVSEMRIHYSDGYRLYYATRGEEMVFLLLGGDKKSQKADIEKAIALWKGLP